MKHEDINKIYSFLCESELFSQVSEKRLKKMVSFFEEVFVPSKTEIISEGEVDDNLFIILHGRVFIHKNIDGREVVLKELGAGEIFGEIGFLIGSPRTASIRTIRDTFLLKMSKKEFDNFSRKNPETSLDIAKLSILRLTSKEKPSQRGRIKTIALVPLTKNTEVKKFIQKIHKNINKKEKSLLVDSEIIQKIDPEYEQKEKYLSAWLNEQEFHYNYILYEADPDNTVWSEICQRQADVIYYICKSDDSPRLRDVEKKYTDNTKQTTKLGLLILQEDRNKLPQNTLEWIKVRKDYTFYHIVPTEEKAIEKAARIITGRSIGLVLSGGGARGAAHIGLLRAIEEFNIPIDVIGGTSIGAIIAGLYAIGYDSKKITEIFPDSILRGSKLDYTFPYLSLAKGRKLETAINTYTPKSIMIEDLWIRFFAISTNISHNQEYVHQVGQLYHALRASASLPGIYPPVYSEEGVLVDGGCLNNLPVEIIQKQFNAGRTMAVLLSAATEAIDYRCEEDSVSGWKILWNFLNPFSQTKVKYPRIDQIMMRSTNIHDFAHQQKQSELADYCLELKLENYSLLDYEKYLEIIEEGYRQARKQLKDMGFG